MNRQTKQRRGRLWWSDDRGFAVADAYLPSISNIRHHHHTKVKGQPLLKEDFCKFSYSNIQRVFQHLSLMRKMSVDWWQSNSLMLPYWSLRLDWQAVSAAKQTHAPDCTPRMGKPFSAESCGKAVHFLFSRGVVNSTFFGGPSVSLLKGFVMPFLQSGYASDRCVQLRGPLGFCGNNYWGAR